MRKEMKAAIDEAVEDRIITALLGEASSPETKRSFKALYRWGGRLGRWAYQGRGCARCHPTAEHRRRLHAWR